MQQLKLFVIKYKLYTHIRLKDKLNYLNKATFSTDREEILRSLIVLNKQNLKDFAKPLKAMKSDIIADILRTPERKFLPFPPPPPAPFPGPLPGPFISPAPIQDNHDNAGSPITQIDVALNEILQEEEKLSVSNQPASTVGATISEAQSEESLKVPQDSSASVTNLELSKTKSDKLTDKVKTLLENDFDIYRAIKKINDVNTKNAVSIANYHVMFKIMQINYAPNWITTPNKDGKIGGKKNFSIGNILFLILSFNKLLPKDVNEDIIKKVKSMMLRDVTNDIKELWYYLAILLNNDENRLNTINLVKDHLQKCEFLTKPFKPKKSFNNKNEDYIKSLEKILYVAIKQLNKSLIDLSIRLKLDLSQKNQDTYFNMMRQFLRDDKIPVLYENKIYCTENYHVAQKYKELLLEHVEDSKKESQQKQNNELNADKKPTKTDEKSN